MRWCPGCQAEMVRVGENICLSCGRILPECAICEECLGEAHHFTQLRAWGIYTGSIRSAIHRLKYDGDITLADILARYLVSLYRQQDWQVDCICPVPVSRARLRMRGYNQAALLAWSTAQECGVRYNSGMLIKCRETRTQVGLNRQARRDNVSQAYRARQELADGKSVLVIDDVITSGATMDACAAALNDAGARSVYGISLARSAYYDQYPD
jgi:ComF family protein